MSFAMPAFHSEQLVLAFPDETRRTLVRSALAKLRWPLREETPRGLRATVWLNFWSYGEVIEVDFLDERLIAVSSRCVTPIQLVDWGKNQANVRQLVREILVQRHMAFPALS